MKYYCDCCEKEINIQDYMDVIISLDGQYRSQHLLCINCIINLYHSLNCQPPKFMRKTGCKTVSNPD